MKLGTNKTFNRSEPWVPFRAAALYDGFDTSASANAAPSSRALDRTRSWLDRTLRSVFSVVLFPIAWPERRPSVVQNTEMPLPCGALRDATGKKVFMWHMPSAFWQLTVPHSMALTKSPSRLWATICPNWGRTPNASSGFVLVTRSIPARLPRYRAALQRKR